MLMIVALMSGIVILLILRLFKFEVQGKWEAPTERYVIVDEDPD